MSRPKADLPAAPPMPRTADDDPAAYAAMVKAIEAHAAALRQRNLMTAVRLAQQAAGGHGPLVEHFAELGRRFGSPLRAPAKARAGLRVIEGGVE